jgi:hypothetical protein
MNRRDLLKFGGGGAVIVAATGPQLLAGITGAVVARKKRDPLPVLKAGDMVTAEWFADMTERVNELSS